MFLLVLEETVTFSVWVMYPALETLIATTVPEGTVTVETGCPFKVTVASGGVGLTVRV